MTFAEYAALLRRYWVSIGVIAILGGAASYGLSTTMQTQYQSTATVLLTSELGGNGSDLLQGSAYVENLVTSYATLATSQRVLDPVIRELGLTTTARSLAGSIIAESPTNTVLIDIHVRDASPDQAARIANAVTASLSRVVADVSPSLASHKPAIRLTAMQNGDVVRVPVAPNKKRWLLVGLLIGAAIGVASALARHTWGSSVAAAAELRHITDVPVVGEILSAPRGQALAAAVLQHSMGAQAESVRGLAANLSFLGGGGGGGIRSIVVTSPSSGEGKSSVSASLAVVLAEAAHRVLLVDADMRKPTAHLLANLDNSIGLTSVLIGQFSLDEASQPWALPGLRVLTSGPLAPNPSQWVNGDDMRKLLEEAAHTYDYVIIDSPPVLTVTDPVWLGHMTDGVLVIVRRSRTKSRALTKALEALAASSTPVAGLVLNRVVRRNRRGGGYYSVSVSPEQLTTAAPHA